MEFKSVGDDLESVCCGCGEVLLISPGDEVNFRSGGTVRIMGMEVPAPGGLLCAKCNKEENPSSRLTIRFARLVCSSCGSEISEKNSNPSLIDEFVLSDSIVCLDCSEPWRRSLCQED